MTLFLRSLVRFGRGGEGHPHPVTALCLSALMLVIGASQSAFSQSVTIGGMVLDTVSLAPIDSARVDIINVDNMNQRYVVYTNLLGLWSFTFQGTSAKEKRELPYAFSLAQNYPNPFNPSTTIGFVVHRQGEATLRVHNVLGQQLGSRNYSLVPGSYIVQWNSTGAAGVLFYTLEMGNERLTRKMVQLDGSGNGGLGEIRMTGGLAPMQGSASGASAQYKILVSKFVYEPDSTTVEPASGMNIDFRLQTVHRRAFLFDLHNDVLELVVRGYQLGVRHSTNHSDIPRFRDGGVDAQMLSVWADPNSYPAAAFRRSMQMIDSFGVQLVWNAATFVQARTTQEILQSEGDGTLAGVLGVEGGHSIENDLSKLSALYERGARYMTITWNNSTAWATSAADPLSATRGLSDFGRQVIRAMDSLGMIIDVSHVGIKTIEDILQTSTKPVIASHSGVRTLRNHTRNLTDAQIISIAQRGGVIGVVFYPWFLSATGTATIDSVIRHIDYIKNLVGIDYAAIGSDFDGIEVTPAGLEDVARFPNLTTALLRHGYSSEEVRKLLGGNYLRVFHTVCN